jgi:hypothetical protein
MEGARCWQATIAGPMSNGLQARHYRFRGTGASRPTLLIRRVRFGVSRRTWRGFLALAVGLNWRKSWRTDAKDSHTSQGPFMSRGLVRFPMPGNKEAIRSVGVATSSEELCRPTWLRSSDAESNSSDDTSGNGASTTASCVLGCSWVVASEGRLTCVWKRVLTERPPEQLPSGDANGGQNPLGEELKT